MESFDQFDEIQILALIEGELSPRNENRLLAKLESNPQVREQVMQMRRDRSELRDMTEIELPRDFLIDLEPLLARPMLMDPTPARKPGEYRRRHERANRRAPGRRYAVAAMILLTLTGGIWAVSSGQAGRGLQALQAFLFEQEEMLPDRLQVDDIADPMVAIEDEWTLEDGILHHYRPQTVTLPTLASTDDAANTPLNSRPNQKIIATVAIVVMSNDAAYFEQSMADILPRFDSNVALVRNYSNVILKTERNASPTPRNVKESGKQRSLDRQVSSELNEFLHPDFEPLRDGQVLGRRDFIPSRDQQVSFDVLGASHTLCIKSIMVNELLGQVATLPHLAIQLRVINDAGLAGMDLIPRSSSQSLADLRKVRAAMAGLANHGDGAVVMIPVIFQD